MVERFKEVSNEWLNTGGHCMVDITTVYDNQDKKLLYMFVSDEWMTLATYDYVQNETPDGTDADDFVVYSIEASSFTTEPAPWNTSMLELPNEYFDLFDHGMLSYIKNTFKYDHQLTKCAVEALPVALRRMVTDDYAAWLNQEELLVTTDGDQIIIDDRYDQLFYDDNGRNAVDFKKLLIKMREDADADNDSLEKFYAEQIHLIINGKVFTLGMSASAWNGLIEYADYIISEQ